MAYNFPIDFVVTWVDQNDKLWRAEKARYSGKQEIKGSADTAARYRDAGLLKYWFRGVEQFAPWVRKIHFVTAGQKPDWLDENNPKLILVNHKDFISPEYLPTYNSVVIERYMHKIPGLADHFVYFNDDFFIIRPVSPERFFNNGLPCDIAIFQYNPSWSQYYVTLKNNIRLINSHFSKKDVINENREKWYTDIYGKRGRINRRLKFYNKFITLRTHHNAQPYLKSTFTEVWDAFGEELKETSNNRFRHKTDYTPELFRTWQICKGNFEPYDTYSDTKMFPLLLRPKKAIEAIRNQSYSLICLNDNDHVKDYELLMKHIREAFQEILPDKSSFEK